jgi:hypothetical protein
MIWWDAQIVFPSVLEAMCNEGAHNGGHITSRELQGGREEGACVRKANPD